MSEINEVTAAAQKAYAETRAIAWKVRDEAVAHADKACREALSIAWDIFKLAVKDE